MRAGIAVAAVAIAVTCMTGAHGGTAAAAAQAPAAADPRIYDTLLHADSPARQRAAFSTIEATPRPYLPQLRQSLRDYPRLLASDPRAARRAVTLATYLRDIAFPGILLGALADEGVEADCAQVCALTLVFAVHTAFGGWHPPLDLNPGLPAVSGFQAAVERIERRLPPAVPAEAAALVGKKTDAQLLAIAAAGEASGADRLAAAQALGATVSRSSSRRELYLLAMNDLPGDGSRAYLAAIYDAIYRAELARTRGR